MQGAVAIAVTNFMHERSVRSRHGGRMAAAIASLLLATGLQAQDAQTRFVAGSRVNLRALPQAGAPVRAVVDINTRVLLLGRNGAWCEVRRDDPAAQGHVACELLAAQPLRLEDVEAQLEGAKPAMGTRRVELTSRAFWLSPSLERWERHGAALDAVLPEADRFRMANDGSGRVLRPAMSDFEAMKAFIASGRMKVEQPRARPDLAAQLASNELLRAALVRAPLPAAVPSFFGAADFDVLVPSGWILSNGGDPQSGADPADPQPYQWGNVGDELRMFDVLSRRFGARLTAVVTAGAVVTRNDDIAGFWNVGSVRLQYAGPGAIETLAPDGRLRSLPVAEADFAWGGGACMRNSTQIAKPARPRGAPGMDGFLLAWVGRKPAGTQALIQSRMREGERVIDRLVVHRVDIDGDKQLDAIVYEGRYEPQISATGLWKAVFVNIAGRWALVYEDRDDDCT